MVSACSVSIAASPVFMAVSAPMSAPIFPIGLNPPKMDIPATPAITAASATIAPPLDQAATDRISATAPVSA